MRPFRCALPLIVLTLACSRERSEPSPVESPPAAQTTVRLTGAIGRAERTLRSTENGFATERTGLADVRYPRDVRHAFTVTDAASGVTVGVAPQFVAAPSEPILDDGRLVFRDVLGKGSALVHRPTVAGTEDYVVLPEGSRESSLAWTLHLGKERLGLRLVENVLAVLDASGTPRLHVSPPTVVDARGVEHDARLAVEGCSYDADPAEPWGRPITAPGAETCTVRVSFDASLPRPLTVDPAWQSTGALATNRTRHVAVAYTTSSGASRVLIAGGANAANTVLSSVEIYDPATNTFATANSMATARADAAGAFEATSKHLIVSGGRSSSGSVLASSERYVLTGTNAGKWQNTGSMVNARYGHTLTPWSNETFLAFGGYGSSGARLDGEQVNGSGWSLLMSGTNGRTRHAAIPFRMTTGEGNCVLILGGELGSAGTITDTTTFYCDGVDYDHWFTGQKMSAPRRFFATVPIASGRWLIAGGYDGTTDLTTAEYLDVANIRSSSSGAAFTPAPSLPSSLKWIRGASLASNRALFVGESGSSIRSFLFDYSSSGIGTWTPAGSLQNAHGIEGMSVTGVPSSALVVGLTGAPEKWAKQSNGATCTDNGECESGFCVEGVCCNTACNETCYSCLEANKASGANGTCGPTKVGGSSFGKCATQGASTCGTDGTCDGAGGCRKYPAGTVCVPGSCAEATETPARTCDGAGTCLATTPVACSTGYACSGAACATSCTDDSSCAAGHYCSGGACVPSFDDGAVCERGRMCKSGYCVDGVCCESACAGACEACSVALKGFGVDGKCEYVLEGTDPRDRCPTDPEFPSSCKSDGLCDGAGACRAFAPVGTGCGTNTCTAGTATYEKCDGAGACVPVAKACTFGGCSASGDACEGDCVKDEDCPADATCDTTTNTCVGKLPDGAVATDPRSCKSGIIADGVCCNTVCDGVCEACAEETTVGTCVAVIGAARHGKTCAPATGSDPCSASACDGVTRDSCAGHPGAETACRAGSCVDGVETFPGLCDGSGVCPAPVTKKCEPFRCGTNSCLETCKSNDDCAEGYVCDPATGKCGRGSTCKDELTVVSSDGVEKTCAPLRCAGQGCLTQCQSSDDCVPGFVCDVGTKSCVATAGATEDDGGGCSLVGVGQRAGAPLGALLLVGLLARRRRQPRA